MHPFFLWITCLHTHNALHIWHAEFTITKADLVKAYLISLEWPTDKLAVVAMAASSWYFTLQRYRNAISNRKTIQ